MGVHPILNATLGTFLRLFIRKIHGLKNVPAEGPFIVAANHDSYLDPFLIDASLYSKINQKIHWLAMMGRFWKFFGDKIAHDWIGCVPLDQGKKKALKELELFLKKGENVGIFPGGPRSLDGSLTRGRTGAARLALGARVPVIPVGLIGTYDSCDVKRL
jgi:1-acyl-sn-glycerol-3-phosphate acyltransferase